LFGVGLLLFILVLPKISELSFSPTNGFVLKLLQEVEESLSEAQSTAIAIEAKLNQQPNQSIIAEPDVAINTINLKDEIRRLENTRKQLESYSSLLESKIDKK